VTFADVGNHVFALFFVRVDKVLDFLDFFLDFLGKCRRVRRRNALASFFVATRSGGTPCGFLRRFLRGGLGSFLGGGLGGGLLLGGFRGRLFIILLGGRFQDAHAGVSIPRGSGGASRDFLLLGWHYTEYTDFFSTGARDFFCIVTRQ
jgi:hypothetical protein